MRTAFSLLAASLGIILTACQPAPAPAAAASADLPAPVPEPAADSAAASGTEGNGSAGTAAFRASGNESGWLAVVDGEAPGLQVEVDDGERRF